VTTYIRIIDETYHEITREADPDERWDGDDSYTSHSIRGYKVVGKKDYYDVALKNDPVEGQPLWLLFVNYDTGNSFQREEGEIEFVDVFSHSIIAVENQRRIQEYLKDQTKDHYTMELRLDTGEKYSYSATAFIGYFESVNDVEVIEICPTED